MQFVFLIIKTDETSFIIINHQGCMFVWKKNNQLYLTKKKTIHVPSVASNPVFGESSV